ncbi:MAG: hypothetical protein JXR82_08245, partial [Marinifilaceae bacterium]|nr:hypothetical protein [Marinifilaceae bacterium]
DNRHQKAGEKLTHLRPQFPEEVVHQTPLPGPPNQYAAFCPGSIATNNLKLTFDFLEKYKLLFEAILFSIIQK